MFKLKQELDDTLDYINTLCNCENKRAGHYYLISQDFAEKLYKHHVGFIKKDCFIYNNCYFNMRNITDIKNGINFKCPNRISSTTPTIPILTANDRIIKNIIE